MSNTVFACKMTMMRFVAKLFISGVVSLLATFAGFSFPKKFSWRWKWEMLSGSYERGTSRLLRRITKEGMVVVDAGAHIGYFTRLMATRVGSKGRVYAFEPDTENLALLRKNTARFSTVETIPEALTSKEGPISFFHVVGSTGCHTTVGADNATHTTVRGTTLDIFKRKHGIRRIHLIKMDIEGGEWSALEGMQETLRTDSPSIVCEYNPSALSRSGKTPEAFLDIFDRYGYQLHVITDTGPIVLKKPYADSIRKYPEKEGSVNVFCVKP